MPRAGQVVISTRAARRQAACTARLPMRARHWLALILGLMLIGGAISLYWLPEIARRVAIARIHGLTQRPVSIEGVELGLLRGRVTVHGFRLGERGEAAPFASIERLDARLHLPSLLVGHLWV